LNLINVNFFKTELNYFGHVVRSEGVRPDPEKVKSIKNFPIPKSTTDVKSFLRLTGYYRKFIPQFSKIAKPLTELLKKGQKWRWDVEQREFSFFASSSYAGACSTISGFH